MSDRLLAYYNQELEDIQRLAGEFAAAHPKIAGRLRLSADAIDDPHAGRLIEAFARLPTRYPTLYVVMSPPFNVVVGSRLARRVPVPERATLEGQG